MLERIDNPRDLKSLKSKEVKELAQDIRNTIISQVEKTGGHMASNLGVVELTLALHRVFESPQDKIIWDVGHQCYAHKLVTGRRDQFSTIRQKNGISGFPRIKESPHDAFDAGHASTSISAALGFELGQRLQGKKGHVIAVIGDGSLTGGGALEAINFAGHLPNNLIIILNDNDMSISANVGAISSVLTRMSSSGSYVAFRRFWSRFWKSIPLIGKRMYGLSERFKGGLKGVVLKYRLFSDLGFRYIGPLDGHNQFQLEKILINLRDNPDGPVVVHVKTTKGKGHKEAEEDPMSYHGVSPHGSHGPTMTSVFGEELEALAQKDQSIVAITAAMEKGTGLTPFRKAYPKRFVDVGITEPLAVTMAASLSLTGLKPVVAIYSTFMQRAVDQVIHDVAINKLPVLFVMDRAGLVPQDGETHQGLFDLSIFRSIPYSHMLAPITSGDLKKALAFGIHADHPVFLRIPKDEALEDRGDEEEFTVGRGFFSEVSSQEKIVPLLIISLGSLLDEARKACRRLEKRGLSSHVYSLRWAWPMDEEFITELCGNYEMVLFLEEGMAQGGMGEYLGSLLMEARKDILYVKKAIPNVFPQSGTREELISQMGLDASSLVDLLMEKWDELRFEKVVDQVRQNKWTSKKL